MTILGPLAGELPEPMTKDQFDAPCALTVFCALCQVAKLLRLIGEDLRRAAAEIEN